MQTTAKYNTRCDSCRRRIAKGDTIFREPPKTFCVGCVRRLDRERFPATPDGKRSEWLEREGLEMVVRELAGVRRRDRRLVKARAGGVCAICGESYAPGDQIRLVKSRHDGDSPKWSKRHPSCHRRRSFDGRGVKVRQATVEERAVWANARAAAS